MINSHYHIVINISVAILVLYFVCVIGVISYELDFDNFQENSMLKCENRT